MLVASFHIRMCLSRNPGSARGLMDRWCVCRVSFKGNMWPIQYKDTILPVEDSRHKGETIMRPSHLNNGDSYTGNTSPLYWDACGFDVVKKMLSQGTPDTKGNLTKTNLPAFLSLWRIAEMRSENLRNFHGHMRCSFRCLQDEINISFQSSSSYICTEDKCNKECLGINCNALIPGRI